MIAPVIRRGFFGFALLIGTASAAPPASSPMSWSPDGQWLGYTVVADNGVDALAAGWLFDTQDDPTRRDARGHEASRAPGQPVYQIWATERNHDSSLLIEQSRWPLSAPSWSPRGGAIAFARFVPQSIEPGNAQPPRGRYEIVIQTAIDHKRVLWSSADVERTEGDAGDLTRHAGLWSPDGKFLVFTAPGRETTLMVVATDSGKVLSLLDDASQPAWSSDGARLAYLRSGDNGDHLNFVERHGHTFSGPRPLPSRGSIKTRPRWSSDRRSILAVVERSTSRPRELAIERIPVEAGESAQVILSLAADPVLRASLLRGVIFELDRELERCYFSIDFLGRDAELGFGLISVPQIAKRFHPLDGSMRIDSIAASPDDQFLALRFGRPGAPTLPLLYELGTDRSTLVAPDECGRRDWVATLVATARQLMVSKLPPVNVDGHLGTRPTLLPAPGELAGNDAIRARLARIARLAAPLCDPARAHGSPAPPRARDQAMVESHLFVSYLQDDFAGALSDLDALEPRLSAPEDRLAVLSLRAQILWSEGHQARAQGIVDYLGRAVGSATHRVEDTPAGPTVTTEPSPRQTWVRYLAIRAAEPPALDARSKLDFPTDLPDIPLQNEFAAPEAPQNDHRGAAPVPFSHVGTMPPATPHEPSVNPVARKPESL